jgi:hypothetical protein
MPESIFAPRDDEGSIPAWTLPAPAPVSDAPAVPEVAPAPDAPAAPEQPLAEGQQAQADHEAEHSKWFDRAKMWAANNLYDPDEDDSVIKPEGDRGQGEQDH